MGEKIKQLRKKLNLTQKQFGGLINVSKVSVCGFENGSRKPKYETLKKMCEIFNCSASDILGF